MHILPVPILTTYTSIKGQSFLDSVEPFCKQKQLYHFVILLNWNISSYFFFFGFLCLPHISPSPCSSICCHLKRDGNTERLAAYRGLRSALPPCGSAASWGWQCGPGRRSPCWLIWHWWPRGSARRRPGRHCGSSVRVMESGGWLELGQKNNNNKKWNTSWKITAMFSKWPDQVTSVWRGGQSLWLWAFLKELLVCAGHKKKPERTNCAVFDWLLCVSLIARAWILMIH